MTRRSLNLWRYALMAVALSGCGDDGMPADPGGADPGETDPGETDPGETDPGETDPGGENPPVVAWGPCPAGFETECAYVPVPLDRDDPTSKSIDIQISRRLGPSQPASAQLWLVNGGPGGSAYAFATSGLIKQLADVLPNVDVYTIEHRGVGKSAQMTCPEQQLASSPGGTEVIAEELSACAQFIDDSTDGGLASFTVSNAARDMQHIFSLTRDSGQQQFLYGVSYGTYLAQRFLRLFPDQIDGVILDSVATPELKFNDYDNQADPVALQLADQCAANPVCSQKLGADPWTTIRNTVTALENGQCAPAGLTGEVVSSLLWGFLDHLELREMLFPVLYRLARCEPADIAAVGHAFNYVQTILSGTPNELVELDTALLAGHIGIAEFTKRPYSAEALLAACEEATFCPGAAQFLVSFDQNWPIYDEPLVDTWPETTTPILAFNGDLDVKTPIEVAARIADYLKGPQQNFYEFADGPHVLVATSPVQTEGAPPCAIQMMVDFIGDPMSPPRDDCLNDLVSFDAEGTTEKAMKFFGTADMWENNGEQIGATAVTGRTAADWAYIANRLRRHGWR